MKNAAAVALSLFAIPLFISARAPLACCQVLTTGQTIGRNAQGVMASENHLFVDGVDLNIAYAQYVRGLTKNFDLYISVGDTEIFSENQMFVGGGGNLHLFTLRKFDVSFFNVASFPVQHRKEASTVLLNSAVVVSRPITEKISLYSGFNTLFPIGARERGVFTPTTKKLNVPLGIAVLGKKWGLFAEGDFGKLKAVGIGLARSF